MAEPVQEMSFEQEVGAAADKAGIKDEAPPIVIPSEEKIPPESVGEPAPEAVKTDAIAPAPPKVETVPLAVHIRQREKLEREMSALREQLNVGNKRLDELVSAIRPTPAPIDRNTDPLGATLQQMDTLQTEVKQTREMIAQREQTERQRQDIENFNRAVAADEQQYVKQRPDLKDAIDYARNMKYQEYVALGLEATQAAARVQQDGYALAMHAFQSGMSPSELAYRVATTLGYKAAAPAAVATSSSGEPAPAKTAAEQAVEMRAAGAARTRQSGAGNTTGQITFADLAAMDNDEFHKMTSGKNWQKLAGG